MMRKCLKLVFAVLLITMTQAFIAAAETASVHVSFSARAFSPQFNPAYTPPADTVVGFFSFKFDLDQPADEYFGIPADVDLIIAEETENETDFSKKVLGVGVQWNGNAFSRIRFWAGGPSFYGGGDDFILALFPEGGGKDIMRYSLSSVFGEYISTDITFDIVTNGCNNDSDRDGVYDCYDLCPSDPTKTRPKLCGCGISEIDTDGDGKLDCMDANDDGDGLYDYAEWGPDQNDTEYDGNGDGIADHLQGNVASFHTFNDQNYITLESPSGTLIKNCTAEVNPSEFDAPLDVNFSFGFFVFSIEGLASGSSSTVKLHIPAGVTFDTYYKYGPTPDNPTDHWYEFLFVDQTGANINGNVITLYFVDGMRGDDDLTNNGTISDTGGPGISLGNGNSDVNSSPVVGGSGGGGGGCFISTVASCK